MNELTKEESIMFNIVTTILNSGYSEGKDAKGIVESAKILADGILGHAERT